MLHRGSKTRRRKAPGRSSIAACRSLQALAIRTSSGPPQVGSLVAKPSRAGYLHLNKAIGDGAARVSMLGDDGNLAGVDTVLSATMEFGMQRIEDVGQRLTITVAIAV